MELLTCYDDEDNDGSVHVEEISTPKQERDGSNGDRDVPSQESLSMHQIARNSSSDFTSALLKSLSKVISDIVPSPAVQKQRTAAWLSFERICRKEFLEELSNENSVSRGIELFGSWTYGMWIESSDIDVNFWTKDCIPNFFKRLKSAVLGTLDGAAVTIVATAKVPVAKISLPHCALQIDVTHQYGQQNEVAQHHISVRDWASRWERDTTLCTSIRMIKAWARARDIMNPYKGTLNSMGYFIMLLAIAERDPAKRPRELDSSELLDSILHLLRRFFSAYADVGTKRQVIRTPFGGSVQSEGHELDILRLRSSEGGGIADEHLGCGSTMFIQDPFLPSVNLARFVNRNTVKKLRREFARAQEMLLRDDVGDAFQRLLEEAR